MIVHIDRNSRAPLYEQIADQLRTLILSGGMPAGRRLPSSRDLADTLSVNRKTVVQAYRMLKAEGLVRGNGRGGTIVRVSGGSQASKETVRPVLWRRLYTDSTKASFLAKDNFYKQFIRSLPPATLGHTIESGLHLWGDRRLLNDAWDAVLSEVDRSGLLLASVRGFPPLREAIARRAAIAGICVPVDCIMIVRNITQITFLLALAMMRRGDSVALEVPCVSPVIHVYDMLGINIHPIPMDGEGPDLNILEGVLARCQPKLLHVFPTYRVPTGTSMSLERRKQLIELVGRYRVPIIETPEFDSLAYEGEPKPSLMAMDEASQTIYGTSLEHELPLALRLGWLAAPPHVIRSLIPIKQAMECSIHPLTQALAHRVLTHPDFSLDGIRDQARRCRDQMLTSLDTYCADTLRYDRPEGGNYIWAKVAEDISLEPRLEALSAHGDLCKPGRFFYPGRRGGERRLAFTFLGSDPSYIERGIAEIGAILRSV